MPSGTGFDLYSRYRPGAQPYGVRAGAGVGMATGPAGYGAKPTGGPGATGTFGGRPTTSPPFVPTPGGGGGGVPFNPKGGGVAPPGSPPLTRPPGAGPRPRYDGTGATQNDAGQFGVYGRGGRWQPFGAAGMRRFGGPPVSTAPPTQVAPAPPLDFPTTSVGDFAPAPAPTYPTTTTSDFAPTEMQMVGSAGALEPFAGNNNNLMAYAPGAMASLPQQGPVPVPMPQFPTTYAPANANAIGYGGSLGNTPSAQFNANDLQSMLARLWYGGAPAAQQPLPPGWNF